MAQTSRIWLWGVVVGLAAVSFGWLGWKALSFPSDRTPEGAYLRVVQAVSEDQPQAFFAYVEEEAQHACFTILDYRKRTIARIQATYPKERLGSALEPFEKVANLSDGAFVFAHYANEEGWLSQLRHDLSAVRSVETAGERASVVTVVGTRYAFRRRPGGIYGLTAFTPFLTEEAERAARDFATVDRIAQGYEASRRTAP